MNGHSKVTVNGNGSIEHRSTTESTSAHNNSNGKARLADSGIELKLSTAFKRFFANFDYFNLSNNACASNSCSRSHSCSNINCSRSNNSHNVYSTNNYDVNAHTALISDGRMSRSLDHVNDYYDANDYFNSQPSTSKASATMQRQRQYNYSIY